MGKSQAEMAFTGNVCQGLKKIDSKDTLMLNWHVCFSYNQMSDILHIAEESVYAERKREDKHKQELEEERKRKAQRKPTERQLITADDGKGPLIKMTQHAA